MSNKSENKPLSLEDVQAQVQAMLDEAQARANEIVAQASAMTGLDDPEIAKKRDEDKARGEELVEIKLFKDNAKYKDPVFVAVNGENCVIERGIRVKVKRKFAEVLDNSDIQDYEAGRYMDAKSAELERSPL